MIVNELRRVGRINSKKQESDAKSNEDAFTLKNQDIKEEPTNESDMFRAVDGNETANETYANGEVASEAKVGDRDR